SEATFERARAEKKFVIVSLQSWWCPWCLVMNKDTWADPEVRAELNDHFIPVHVDQDSRPDISQRYERWGWPATIIFGPAGTKMGDAEAAARIKRTLTAMIALIDKESGGISQVTLQPDWSKPSLEFPMFAQQAALTAYARAWGLFGDPAYRATADRIYGFLRNT